jgi:hypothetical protein
MEHQQKPATQGTQDEDKTSHQKDVLLDNDKTIAPINNRSFSHEWLVVLRCKAICPDIIQQFRLLHKAMFGSL